MATQSGIVTFDRRPLATVDERDYCEGGAFLSQGADGVWTNERRGRPAAGAPSGLIATFDGRIDNRDELQLRLPRSAPAMDDAQLMLALFEQGSCEALRAVIGDWSLAIWDPRTRILYLARDYMGARPLYYCLDRRYVAWSSDLAELVTRTRRADALSDRFAARFMSLRVSCAVTPYQDVFAVPPGVAIAVSNSGQMRTTRLWTLDAGEIRCASAADYEEQLRALWRDAVHARLQTSAGVWAELSGGLDSSSVACMADRLIHRGDVPARSLRFVSHATLQSPEGDERRFIAEVERQTGVDSEIIGVEEHHDQADPQTAWVTPYALHGVGLATVRRIVDGGGRVVLSGRLGDAVMGCQPDNSIAVFDDLARGRGLAAARALRRWSRSTRKPFIELLWRLFTPESSSPPESGVDLLSAPLQAMVREIPPVDVPAALRRSKRPLARMILGYSTGARLDVPHRSPDIVYAYPFTHRPLIDFMLAIPGEQLSAPGDTRSLMRRAFASFVPGRILRRVSKGYYPPAAFRAARRLAASMLPVNDLEVVQRGWIDPIRLQAALRSLTDGGGESGGDIHCVLRLEAWLAARRTRSAIPNRKEVTSHALLNT